MPVSYDVEHVVEGHLMKITATFENMILVFINVYAPVLRPERVVFLEKIKQYSVKLQRRGIHVYWRGL